MKIEQSYVNGLETFFHDTVDEVLRSLGAGYITEEAEKKISVILIDHTTSTNLTNKENWNGRPFKQKRWYNYYGSVLFNTSVAVWICEISLTMCDCPISSDGYGMFCERKVFIYDLVRDRP